MRDTRFIRAAVLAVTAAAVCVAGAAGARAQELVVAVGGNVTSIDPHFHNLSPNSNIALHIFDRLAHQDEQQKLIPGLATEWKAIDETTWEFKLRKGVKFHDGGDFDAQDVVATLKRVPWVPNSPSAFTIYTRAVAATEVVDPHTIRFKTARPYPLLPIDLSSINIVSRKAVEAPTADFNSGKVTFGTGPFRFVQYLPGDRIALERNDAYWGPKPAWTKVTIRIITNDSARLAALLAGDVQAIDTVPTADLPKLKTNKDITLSRIGSNRVIYLHLDSFRDQTPMIVDSQGQPLAKNPLKDPRVRLALSHAINRKGITDRIFEGEAMPAGGLLPVGFFGASPKLTPPAFDPDRSKKLLAEAGYPQGFALTINGPSDRYPNDARVLEALGPMFERIGLSTKVATEPWATYAGKGSAPGYAYSVLLVGWGSGTGEVSSPLRSLIATVNRDKGMGPSNRGRYSNPEVDKVLEEALATVDDAKRDKLLQQATEIAMNDVAIIPLYYQVNIWGLRQGFAYKPRADEFTLAQFITPAKN